MNFHPSQQLTLSNDQKKYIFHRLKDRHQISFVKRNLMFLRNDEIRSEHLISNLTYGSPSYLYLSKTNDECYCVLINIMPPKTPTHEVGPQSINMVRLRLSWKEEVWEKDTVLEGELITTNLGGKLFLARDVLVFQNRLQKRNFVERYKTLVSIANHFIPVDEMDPIHFQVVKITSYPKFKSYLHEFIPALPYPSKGLCFHNPTINYKDRIYLFPDRKEIFQANRQPYQHLAEPYPQNIYSVESKDTVIGSDVECRDDSGEDGNVEDKDTKSFSFDIPDSYQKSWLLEHYDKCQPIPVIVASLEKTTQPEIYQLSLKNKDSKSGDVGYILESIGYAHIPTLKMSRLIRKALDKDGDTVKVECSFNTEFQKWQPITITDSDIQSYDNLKQQISTSYQSSVKSFTLQ